MKAHRPTFRRPSTGEGAGSVEDANSGDGKEQSEAKPTTRTMQEAPPSPVRQRTRNDNNTKHSLSASVTFNCFSKDLKLLRSSIMDYEDDGDNLVDDLDCSVDSSVRSSISVISQVVTSVKEGGNCKSVSSAETNPQGKSDKREEDGPMPRKSDANSSCRRSNRHGRGGNLRHSALVTMAMANPSQYFNVYCGAKDWLTSFYHLDPRYDMICIYCCV